MDELDLQSLALRNYSYVGYSKISTIRSYAFLSHGSLYSASFPDVTLIGAQAFKSAYNLRSIYFPKLKSIGDSAFTLCSSLSEITLPNISVIGGCAFESNNNLETVVLNESSTVTIYSSAFHNCRKLKTVSGHISYVHSCAFQGCSALESIECDYIRGMSYAAFAGCHKLSSFAIDSSFGINAWNSGLFNLCYNLRFVSYKEINGYISNYVFTNCRRLSVVSIANLSNIIAYAFSDCVNIRHIVLDTSRVVSIASNAFGSYTMSSSSPNIPGAFYRDFISLITVYVRSSLVSSYQNNASWSSYISYGITFSTLEDFVMPSENEYEYVYNGSFLSKDDLLSARYSMAYLCAPNLISISSYCFDHCVQLKSIVLQSVTIGTAAFTALPNISYAKLEDVTYISSLNDINMFSQCFNLECVEINNAPAIQSYMFANCPRLSSLIIRNVSVIGYSAFSGVYSVRYLDLQDAVSFHSNAFAGFGGSVFIRLKNLSLSTSFISTWGNGQALSLAFILENSNFYNRNLFNSYFIPFGVYIPDSYYSDYSTSPFWSNYLSVLFKFSELPDDIKSLML